MKKNNIYVYLIIISFVFFINIILLKNGLYKGDDLVFHVANVNSVYNSFKNNNSLISATLLNGIGYGTRLFYAPLTHFFPALFMVVFNIKAINAIKLCYLIFVSIGAISMFKLMLKLTNSKYISLFISFAFVSAPYLLFDFYKRDAIAECYALCMLPLFMNGLYNFIYPKNYKFTNFILLISSSTIIFLIHNITALYLVLFGIIFIIICYKDVLKNLKNKRYLLNTIVSVLIIFMLVSFFLARLYSVSKEHIYSVFDQSIMATTRLDLVVRYLDNFRFSGLFYNFNHLNHFYLYLFINVILYILFSLCYILSLRKVNNKYKIVINIIYLLLSLVTLPNTSLFISATFTIIAVNYIYYKEQNVQVDVNIKHIGLLLIITIFMILIPIVWFILPSPFLNIQFGFRLYSFVVVFFLIFAGILISKYSNSFKKIIICIICITPLFSNSLLSVCLSSNSFITNDYDYNKDISSIGWQREYLPVIYNDSSYESKYDKSLYYVIRKDINNYSFDSNLSPVVLKGDASFEVINNIPSSYIIKIDSADESLTQLPIIYYPGYKLYIDGTITDLDSFKDTDYLISIKALSGKHEYVIKYEGTKIINYSKYISIFGIIFAIIYSIFDYIIFDLKRKKKTDEF